MKAMLWKELRENLKWGALAFLALIMGEFYALSAAHTSSSDNYRDLTLMSSAFLLVSAFGCSAIGVGLALVQVLPELRRDQWAALLQRPVSRGTIFLGKVGAGLLLYLGATLLAFVASVAYVIMPGQFAAPMVPGMLIPGLSDLCLGMAFYSGTLLICLDRGPWWTRRLVVGFSLILLLGMHLTAGFPFLLPMVASAIYLVAAWDALPHPSKRLIWLAWRDYDSLRARFGDRPDILVLKEDWAIDRLMVASDLAITKGNRTTVCEAAFLGLPSISISSGVNWPDDVAIARVRSNSALRAGGVNAADLAQLMAERIAGG